MRISERNKRTLKYALLSGSEIVYKRDSDGNKIIDFVDSEGNVYYQEQGERLVYADPVEFKAHIAYSGGEVQQVEFGVDVTAYDATLVYLLKEFPITETTLIWCDSEPIIDDDGNVDPNSADYKVLSVKPSRRFTKVLLGKLAK